MEQAVSRPLLLLLRPMSHRAGIGRNPVAAFQRGPWQRKFQRRWLPGLHGDCRSVRKSLWRPDNWRAAAGQPQLWVRLSLHGGALQFQQFQNNFAVHGAPAGRHYFAYSPCRWAWATLQQFAQRARNAFVVQNGPARPSGIKTGYIQGINWTRMDTNFLGTVSRFDYWKD